MALLCRFCGVSTRTETLGPVKIRRPPTYKYGCGSVGKELQNQSTHFKISLVTTFISIVALTMVNEGGQLLLLNGTPYTWKKKAEWNYQMNSFSFPSEVLPGMMTVDYYIHHIPPFQLQTKDS
jgi:hypothetical protein